MFLHWLEIKERIQYKLHSLTKPSPLLNLHTSVISSLFNPVAVLVPHLSLLITLAHPPASFSLQDINCSFRYPPPSLWNKLPNSFRAEHSSLHSVHFTHASSPDHHLHRLSLRHSFTSGSKLHLFHKSFPS